MAQFDEDLPVLNAVVESGNRSIIQSSRLGNEVLRELESLRVNAARFSASAPTEDTEDQHPASEIQHESATLRTSEAEPVELPTVEIPQGLDFASLGANQNQKLSLAADDTDPLLDGLNNNPPLSLIQKDIPDNFKEESLEQMIDETIDRHVSALRRDIKKLLERALRSP